MDIYAARSESTDFHKLSTRPLLFVRKGKRFRAKEVESVFLVSAVPTTTPNYAILSSY